MQQKIEQKLNEALSPNHLDVVNESALHSGHAGDDGSGESHFRIIISAERLKTLSRVAAQRRIYEVLVDEMKIIHALTINIT